MEENRNVLGLHFVVFIDWKQRGCGGYVKALPSLLCGQLNQWLHHWIQKQANTVIFLNWVTGVSRWKWYHARKWVVKLIGSSWDCSAEHLVEQALVEGRCMFMKEKGGRQKVCKWKFLIASSFREMKETHSRVHLSPAPWACTLLRIALCSYWVYISETQWHCNLLYPLQLCSELSEV